MSLDGRKRQFAGVGAMTAIGFAAVGWRREAQRYGSISNPWIEGISM